MGEIFLQIPHWKIGTVDSTIKDLYRTFDMPDSNVYNFLMTDVQEAYECLVIFDIMTRTINIYDKNNYVNHTSILLTKDDVIESIKMTTGTDNVFTALKVEGGGELDITDVNPLGTSVIYNFSHFKNAIDMGQDLIDAVGQWEQKVKQAESDFSSINLQLANAMGDMQILESDYNELEIHHKNYISQRDAMIAEGIIDLSNITEQVDDTKKDMIIKQAEIDSKQVEVDNLYNQRNFIYDNVSFENNFSDEQFAILSRLIKMSTYKNDNIIITDGMTFEGEQEQRLELYELGKKY